MTTDAGSGGHDEIRASDRDRDDVIERLTQAVTDGRLTLDEYDERTGAALTARTHGDLAPLTRDLGRTQAPAAPAPAPAGRVERISAVLGNESRKGRWVVPEHLSAKSVLGDCHLEMQNATLRSRVTTIDAVAILGSITIFVPEGLDVRMTGTAILGARSFRLREQPRPGAPILQVNCHVRGGSVTVRPAKRRYR